MCHAFVAAISYAGMPVPYLLSRSYSSFRTQLQILLLREVLLDLVLTAISPLHPSAITCDCVAHCPPPVPVCEFCGDED